MSVPFKRGFYVHSTLYGPRRSLWAVCTLCWKIEPRMQDIATEVDHKQLDRLKKLRKNLEVYLVSLCYRQKCVFTSPRREAHP